MQICGGQSPTICTAQTGSLDIGTTTSSNPTFSVNVTGNQTAVGVALIVLVPSNSVVSNLGFTATFTNGTSTVTMNVAGPSVTSSPFQSDQELLSYLGVACSGTHCNDGGQSASSYHFNSINAVQSVSGVTGYSGLLLDAWRQHDYQLKRPQCLGQFSNFLNGSSFPAGTIFLALGLDSSGNIIYKTPLTVGEEILSVPEYGSMSMMLFSAAMMLGAMVVRRPSSLGTP
jgi:hypothetical protein